VAFAIDSIAVLYCSVVLQTCTARLRCHAGSMLSEGLQQAHYRCSTVPAQASSAAEPAQHAYKALHICKCIRCIAAPGLAYKQTLRACTLQHWVAGNLPLVKYCQHTTYRLLHTRAHRSAAALASNTLLGCRKTCQCCCAIAIGSCRECSTARHYGRHAMPKARNTAGSSMFDLVALTEDSLGRRTQRINVAAAAATASNSWERRCYCCCCCQQHQGMTNYTTPHNPWHTRRKQTHAQHPKTRRLR
jgi:hypothetical protein